MGNSPKDTLCPTSTLPGSATGMVATSTGWTQNVRTGLVAFPPFESVIEALMLSSVALPNRQRSVSVPPIAPHSPSGRPDQASGPAGPLPPERGSENQIVSMASAELAGRPPERVATGRGSVGSAKTSMATRAQTAFPSESVALNQTL